MSSIKEMENILNQQNQLMSSMNRSYENYKKDGPSRRTVSSISSKLTALEGFWQEFLNNHKMLLEYESEDCAYFAENIFQKTKSFYESATSILMNHLEIAKQGQPSPRPAEHPAKAAPSEQLTSWADETVDKEDDDAIKLEQRSVSSKDHHLRPEVGEPSRITREEDERDQQREHLQQGAASVSKNQKFDIPQISDSINQLQLNSSRVAEKLRKQQSNFKAFSRTICYIDLSITNERWGLEDLLKMVQSRWAAIDSLHWDIDSELLEDDDTYNQAFYKYEKKFQDIKKQINSKIWSMTHREKSTPIMDIPTFGGNYHQWTSFKDLFNEAIHSNHSMSNAQKMQFLKNKVKGEAEKLIQHLNISSENYEACWEILNHRYNNKKLIFTAHLNNLLSISTMQHQSYGQIKRLHDTTNECLNAIRNLGVDTSSWDPLIVHILSQKLDAESHTEYIESLKNPRDLPTLKDFLNFLEMKFTSFEASRRKQDVPKQSAQPETSKKPFYKSFGGIKDFSLPQKKSNDAKSSYFQRKNCPVCNNNHGIFHCDIFQKAKPDSKRNIISKLNLCRNCLYNHYDKDCFSESRCRTCNGKHNTLVHEAYASQYENADSPNKRKHVANITRERGNTIEILLATALIKVKAADGNPYTLRALIDQGSQMSLITENAAQLLQLPRQRCKGVVFGIGAKENNCKGVINIAASSLHSDFQFGAELYIMKTLINHLPNQTFSKPTWSYLDGLQLADPEFYVSRPVDLLLGADVYATIIQGGLINQSESLPVAQQTRLGWILCGHVPSYQTNIVINNLDDIMRFWTIEDIAESSSLSSEDQHCLKYYQDTTVRQDDGRYVVRLPLKPGENSLGTSKNVAVSQFIQLERRLQKDQNLKNQYKAFIHEYIDLGHMRDCTNEINNLTPDCYLPHHCVQRADSTTTSLRVVFNASSKTSNGLSLNDIMYSGPNLQQDLLSLIIKWRQYQIAFTADIEKMFRQICLDLEDQSYQKIIWRDNPHQQLREYALATVTYGTKAAPFLAMMTLTLELHGFCDASTKAYACAIYARVINQDDKIESPQPILVAGKSKLIPTKKKITLPRLELCSAMLLSTLMSKVIKSLSNFNIKIYGWSDSTAVLGWLQGDPSKWKPFVSNRVAKIIKIIPPTCWNYVKSEENPADCASRGIKAEKLVQHPLWWNGPKWLSSYSQVQEKPTFTTDEEIKISKQVATKACDDVIYGVIHNNSDMTKATRIVARILRIASRNQQKPTYLTADELRNARNKIIKYVQEREFAEDIKKLKQNQSVDSKSNILQLRPFLDHSGMLRVRGRLQNANISWDMKYPLIIPHSGRLTQLLIDQAHKQVLHGSARLTLSKLKESYWIIGGNRATKNRLLRCIKCLQQKPVQLSQIMGDLPASRTNQTRPFYNTGVDYTGFVNVKANKGRGIKTTKGYIAVFVCMATKAVHLELVSDLSSESFLAALRRMSARRGAPRNIYSDNGTNFVGANKAIKREYQEIKASLDEPFFNAISDMNITWHFNAPAWPSAGGLWEAAVKSLKHHLRRVLGEQLLTFEEYSTLLAQIEGCLNARPLCALSEDPDDLDYITPSHFLSSGPTLNIVETERDERTRWRLTQKMVNDIWKRWQAEYLCQLQSRCKWQRPTSNIKVDDVVIIHDANLPVGKWALGRVLEVHPGKDGYVRVASVKTKNGIIKRPIIKLSVLPVSQNDETKVGSPKPDQKNPIPPLSTRAKTSTSNKSKLINFITMALTLFALLISPAQCNYSVSSFKEGQLIYFDKVSNMKLVRDEWKLVVYYNINPYWQGVELLSEYVSHLENTCPKIESQTQCNIVLMQLHHASKELNYYDSLLLGERSDAELSRTRRGLINGIGNIAHSLFGVLDEQFAEQYQKDIELTRLNEKHLAKLWKNQTSIIEAEYNLLKRVEDHMQKQHMTFSQHLSTLEASTKELGKQLQLSSLINEFTVTSIIANNILENLKSIQDTLLDTITNVLYEKFNIHLLTPKQLKDELNIIAGQLPKDLALPCENINTDLPKLYQQMKVRTRMTREFLIFEIKIPLVYRDTYELFRLISIPQRHENNMIKVKPIANHVAINMQKETFIPMLEEIIQKCTHYDADLYICTLQGPIYQLKSDAHLCITDQVSNKCKADTTACRSIWSELSVVNTYLFFCCEKCTARIICGQQVTAEHLSNSGIITLHRDCVINGDTFTIYSKMRPSSEVKTQADVVHFQIPSINNVINLTMPVMKEQTGVNEEDQKYFKVIKNKIEQMKAEGTLSDHINYHDVHHYTVIYVVAAIVIVIASLYVRRCIRRRQLLARLTPPARSEARPRRPRGPTPRSSTSRSSARSAEQRNLQAERQDLRVGATTLNIAAPPPSFKAFTSVQ